MAGHDVGGGDWFAAVAKANEANGDHMGQEERQGLTDVRRHAPLQRRHDLGVAFAAFDAANIDGVDPVDKDPAIYVEEHAHIEEHAPTGSDHPETPGVTA